MSSKLKQTLALAERGFYVFPCESNGKMPSVPWRERSTRNTSVIRDWFIDPYMGWEQDINIGIDCAKSGITAIDIDVKPGKEGKESYERLHREYTWPDTLTVRTPSGGLHLYYQGNGFRNTTGDKPDRSFGPLGAGIDTRGEGGYLIAPGSTIDGKEYVIIKDEKMAELPSWLKEKLKQYKHVPTTKRESEKTIIADHPDDVQAAIEFLQEHEGAIEGHGGDHHTYQLFCQLKERGISRDNAIELADEYWNPNCSPPWDLSDLILKAESAYRSAQNATGVKSPLAEFDIPENSPSKAKHLIPKNYSKGLIWRRKDEFPKRDWVFGKMALAKNVTLLIAPPGVGKSTLSLAIALSKTSGKNVLGIEPLEREAVAIFNNEDTLEEQERRIVAAAHYYTIAQEDVGYPDVCETSMLFINGRDNALLKIAKRDAEGRLRSNKAEQLVAYLLENKIRLLIVDPLSMTHDGSENSNEDMLTVGSIYAAVADKANCAIILVHHTRKLDAASSEGHSGNLDSARGASSLGGLARVAYTLNVLSKQEASRIGISERDKNNYLLLEQAKANMSAPGEHRLYFERQGVFLGTESSQESVGVLRLTTFADRTLENTKPAIADFIKDIEECIEKTPLTIPELVAALQELPIHAAKKPKTLDKTLRRLLEENILTGIRGTIYLEEKRGIGGLKKHYVRLEMNKPLSITDIV